MTKDKEVVEDVAFISICNILTSDKLKIWNAVELYETYLRYDGRLLSRTEFLITNLKQYFGNDLLVLTSPGISSIVVFREKASTLFNITDEVTSDLDTSLSIVSKHVTNEVKGIAINKNKYTTEFDRDSALKSVSDTYVFFSYAVS